MYARMVKMQHSHPQSSFCDGSKIITEESAGRSASFFLFTEDRKVRVAATMDAVIHHRDSLCSLLPRASATRSLHSFTRRSPTTTRSVSCNNRGLFSLAFSTLSSGRARRCCRTTWVRCHVSFACVVNHHALQGCTGSPSATKRRTSLSCAMC